jgi:hypothetical protein
VAWHPPEAPVLPRRRIVQDLGLSAVKLGTGQDVGFEFNLRLWAPYSRAGPRQRSPPSSPLQVLADVVGELLPGDGVLRG